MMLLKDKKVIILGDRDGVPGQAIEECETIRRRCSILIHRMLCLNGRGRNGSGKSKEGKRIYRGIRC